MRLACCAREHIIHPKELQIKLKTDTHSLINRCYNPSIQVCMHVQYALVCTHPAPIFRAVYVIQLCVGAACIVVSSVCIF